jgi:hypothetical protein
MLFAKCIFMMGWGLLGRHFSIKLLTGHSRTLIGQLIDYRNILERMDPSTIGFLGLSKPIYLVCRRKIRPTHLGLNRYPPFCPENAV